MPGVRSQDSDAPALDASLPDPRPAGSSHGPELPDHPSRPSRPCPRTWCGGVGARPEMSDRPRPDSPIRIGKLRSTPKGRTIDSKALQEVQQLLGDAPRRRDLLIEHLHKIQDRFGCLGHHHLVALAHEMKLAMTEVYEVASFYHHFDIVKEGAAAPPPVTVRVCDSLACELAGAREL